MMILTVLQHYVNKIKVAFFHLFLHLLFLTPMPAIADLPTPVWEWYGPIAAINPVFLMFWPVVNE